MNCRTYQQGVLDGAQRPVQSGYIESFNGRMRDELLNEAVFTTFARTRAIVAV